MSLKEITFKELRDLIDACESKIVVFRKKGDQDFIGDVSYNNTCKKTDWNEKFYNSFDNVYIRVSSED